MSIFSKHYSHYTRCRQSLRLVENSNMFHSNEFPRRKAVSQKVRWLLRIVWDGCCSWALPLAPTSLCSFEKHQSRGALKRHFQRSIKKTAVWLAQRGCSGLSVYCKVFPFCVRLRLTDVTRWSCYLYSFVFTFKLYFNFLLAFSIHRKVENKQKTDPERSPNKDNFAGSLNYNWNQEQGHNHVLPLVCHPASRHLKLFVCGGGERNTSFSETTFSSI